MSKSIEVDETPGRPDLLSLLASGDPPAFATDNEDRVIFWNRGAERVLGREAASAIGRRCHEVLGGRDVFGNRFCHPNCAVVAMARRGERVQEFELLVAPTPPQEKALNVTILQVQGARRDLFSLVHILQPVDAHSRLARALERLGATPAGSRSIPVIPRAHQVLAPPPLTGRESEILGWVAAGLQNKEIAQRLEISLSTTRNHVHNILEKLGVHSKLEAVSLAFRQGWIVAPGSASGLPGADVGRRTTDLPQACGQAAPRSVAPRSFDPFISPKRNVSFDGDERSDHARRRDPGK